MSIYMYIILCISLKNSKCLEVACFPTNFYKKHFYFTIYMIDFCHRGGEWPFKNVESRQIYASLGISALKNSVSESRISRNMTVSESQILKVWISESRILKIWISESRILKIWISPMGRSIFYPQAYPIREIKKFNPAGICTYNCYVKYI